LCMLTLILANTIFYKRFESHIHRVEDRPVGVEFPAKLSAFSCLDTFTALNSRELVNGFGIICFACL
jgi:hypothetical protein